MEKREYNLGIALLRIWMCFEVVLCHFRTWTIKGGILYEFQGAAVPVFMLVAFVFCDVDKLVYEGTMKKRMCRLIIPHLFWTFVYYLVYRILDIKNGTGLLRGKTDIIWQLVLGHSYNATLWFQIDLLILTILFWFVFRIFKRKVAIIVSLALGWGALYIQYAEILISTFDEIVWPESIMGGYFSEFYVVYPVGRLIEMIPYAVVGIGLCSFIKIDKKYGKYIVIGNLGLLSLFYRFKIFIGPEKGFGYQGIELIIMGYLLFTIFYYLPLNKIPENVQRIIREVSKNTMAIYFIHRLVGTVIYNTQLSVWLKMRQGSMYDCCVIFVVSYIIGKLIYLIPIKWIKMSVS